MAEGLFRINAPDVINEVIDGEAIILHLGTGRYYSARGCGAQVWSWLSTAVPLAKIAELVSARYDASESDIEQALDAFVDQLRQEGLIVETGEAATAPDDSPPDQKSPFEPPSVECYNDLQDLLLLDPVHEVDSGRGWPHASDDTAGAKTASDAKTA